MQKLSKTAIITIAALMVALSVILTFLSIPVSNIVIIRFGYIPLGVASYLLGPFYGAIVGAVSDVIGYFIKPMGPFFPGFIISAVLTAINYGIFFYKRKVTFTKILIAEIIHTFAIALLLNSLWLSILYGKGYIPLISARLIKELTTLPINIGLLYVVLNITQKIGIRKYEKA